MGAAVMPPRELEQRRAALRTANRIRTIRAQAKQALKTDTEWRRLIALVLHVEPPVSRVRLTDGTTVAAAAEHFQSMKVVDALIASHQIGRVKALAILKATGCSPSKTLGGLSGRQRRELTVELARRSARLRDERQARARKAPRR